MAKIRKSVEHYKS